MSGEPFSSRVQALHDSWEERRLVRGLAGTHDFDSQFRLLATLHAWAHQAVLEVGDVYGEAVTLAVSPPPERAGADTAFQVMIASAFVLTFSLTERRRVGSPRWSISVSFGSPGPGGGLVAAGPERRNGQWTRSRVEDLLLSLLGAFERSLGDGPGADSTRHGLDVGGSAGRPLSA